MPFNGKASRFTNDSESHALSRQAQRHREAKWSSYKKFLSYKLFNFLESLRLYHHISERRLSPLASTIRVSHEGIPCR